MLFMSFWWDFGSLDELILVLLLLLFCETLLETFRKNIGFGLTRDRLFVGLTERCTSHSTWLGYFRESSCLFDYGCDSSRFDCNFSLEQNILIIIALLITLKCIILISPK